MRTREAARRTVAIGPLVLESPLVMAPMAGLTNIAFRRLLAELGGAGLYYSEMLGARALSNEKPGNSAYLSLEGEARPLCAQVFASRPEEIAPAIEKGGAWSPDAWDFNLGCPAPAVTRQGAGSALMGDIVTARKMAAAMRSAVKGPLLFKVRALPEREEFTAFLSMLVEEGADAVVVHGRHPGEKLGRPARRSAIALAASTIDVPVIGNGDIRDAAGAVGMMKETGCDAVMIGRGAVERPWIFRETGRLCGVNLSELPWRRKSEVFARMAVLLQECYGPPKDMPRLRVFAKYFAANYKYGHDFWKLVNSSKSVDEAIERAVAFGGRYEREDALEEESLV